MSELRSLKLCLSIRVPIDFVATFWLYRLMDLQLGRKTNLKALFNMYFWHHNLSMVIVLYTMCKYLLIVQIASAHLPVYMYNVTGKPN